MRISVVIPMYNSESTIKRALDSVLNQTMRPEQVIVVDDCSTDRSVEIVEQYAKEKGIIRLICCDYNGGAQKARNIGIKATDNSPDMWIAFLDADDEWLENKLELQIEYLRKNPECILAFGDAYEYTNEGMHYRKCGVETIYSYDNFSSATVLFPAMIVKKCSLESIDYLDNRVPCYQEWDTAIRLVQNYKFVYVNKPLFNYYLDKGEHISTSIRSIDGFRYIVLKNRNIFAINMGIDVYDMYISGLRDRQRLLPMKSFYGFISVLYRLFPLRKLKKKVAMSWMGARYHFLYGN